MMDKKITEMPEIFNCIKLEDNPLYNPLLKSQNREQMNLRKADEMEKLLKDRSLDLDTKAKVDLIETIAHLRAGGDM